MYLWLVFWLSTYPDQNSIQHISKRLLQKHMFLNNNFLSTYKIWLRIRAEIDRIRA